MDIGKEVGRSVKLTDNVKPQSLSVADQLRLMLAKFSNDDVAELSTQEKLSTANLKKVSSLSLFLDKAVMEMEKREETSVTLSVSSEYLPYIDDVVDTTYGMGRFYNIEQQRQDLPVGVAHKFVVIISKKE